MRIFLFLALALSYMSPCAFAEKNPKLIEPVVVVDKKSNQLHLTNYTDGKLEIVQSFHTTLGQKVGDKMLEGDLKTPEGIYEFMFRAHPPQLKPIFGTLAIYVSYPNPMDKRGDKTGFDILVHGTDDPSRLERDFDSKGCVVLDNNNVKIVSDNIELKNTKIIITRDFSALSDFARLTKARAFLDFWINAWSSKNIDQYLDSYADEFTIDKMNRIQYGKFKQSLNEKYNTIEVKAEKPRFYFHEKYDVVEFDQNYRSTFANGATAFQGHSKKRLYLQERNGNYRIVIEETAK